MFVRMLVNLTGTRDGADWPTRGGVLELPDTEGAELIAAGMCEETEAPTAVEAPVEDAPADGEVDPDAPTDPDAPVAPVESGAVDTQNVETAAAGKALRKSAR